MASAESVALTDQKRALRRVMSETRSRLGADERARASAGLAVLLSGLPELRAAAEAGACVAGFAATRDELDPGAALADARHQGASLAWPRVSESDRAGTPRLHFHLAEAGDLRAGRFGIAEPDPSAPELAAGQVAVMLVPGLAFDARGNRLGFGGGYYDEVLAVARPGRPALVVGVGYDFQVVDECPADERDARVDCVVTDARVIRCRDDRKVGL